MLPATAAAQVNSSETASGDAAPLVSQPASIPSRGPPQISGPSPITVLAAPWGQGAESPTLPPPRPVELWPQVPPVPPAATDPPSAPPAGAPSSELPSTGTPSPGSPSRPALSSGPNLTSPGSSGFGGAAGGGLGLLFNPVFGKLPYAGGYGAIEFFDAPVPGQNTHLGYVQQNVTALAPIWQDSHNELFLDAGLNNEAFDTQAILPDTHQRFPADLWRIGLGTGYRHLFDNGSVAGTIVNIGSASDKPFSAFNVMTIDLMSFYRKANSPWLLGFALSSNSQVLQYIPIPIVAYLYAPSPRLQAMLGSFSTVVYRPREDVILTASYAPLTNFHAHAAYRITKKWNLFTGIDFDNENYWRAERVQENQRFFYYNNRVPLGMQYAFSPNALVELSGGYVFDRFYFEGKSFLDQSFNHVRIDPSAFVGIRFQARF